MRTVICCIVGILLASVSVNAAYNIDTSEVDKALEGEYAEYIGGQRVENANLQSGLASLLKKGLSIARSGLKTAFIPCFSIIICCSVLSVVKSFSYISKSQLAIKVSEYTGAVIVAIIAISSGGGLLTKCTEAVSNISLFSKIITPVYGVAAAVAQHPSAAITTAGATMLFTNLFTTMATQLFMPLVYVYVAAVSAGAICEINTLSRLCELIKWFLGFSWKFLLVVYTGYISAAGTIASGTDAATLKTAKLVISSAVPVIGGIIADASDAILSGAVIVKNSIGIIGFLGICSMCLVPFVGCFIHYFVYKITSAVSSSLSGGAVAKVIDGIASAYGLALGCLGACSAVQFVSIVVMSAVTMI